MTDKIGIEEAKEAGFKPDWEEGEVDIKFTPDSQFNDIILSKSLQKRIDEIDDDDSDGDILVNA